MTLVVVLTIALIGLCRSLLRRAFRYAHGRAAESMQLDEKAAVENPVMLLQSLAVLAPVMAAFVPRPVRTANPRS
ncbi:hypothetical protein [Sphaerimonospora mesophila]|uniref:hypothetical protein n=1 Tax=Sphaerimonospora mesophila TaxID=37483 RepID=UPI0006E2A2AD